MRKFLLAAVLICTAASSGLARDSSNLVLKDLSGIERSLSDYQGRIVIVNFWATWCVPCVKEMPLLTSVQERYAASGVQVIGASADLPKTQNKIAGFVGKLKINFPIWIGATTSHMQALGLGDALPATAIIDRDGKIVARIQGVIEKGELDRVIEWLIGDRQQAAPSALLEKPATGHEHHQTNPAAASPEKPATGHEHHQMNNPAAASPEKSGEAAHHDHGSDKKAEEHSHHHDHGDENHEHGVVSIDGASSVPS